MENKSNIKQAIKKEYNDVCANSNKAFNLALVFATVVLFVYCYFGSFSFFEKTFSNAKDLHYWKIIYHNCMSFVLFFCLGVLYTKFVIKEPLKNYGLKLENKKLASILIAIALPITALCGLSTVLDKGMTSTYPLVNLATYGSWYHVLMYFASYFLYYVGWEYLFRGLLLNTTKNALNPLAAILLTTLVSALIHTSIGGFGKPMVETLSAIPAGLIFGYIAHKTKSIYPTLLIHFFVGLFTDIFIFFLA